MQNKGKAVPNLNRRQQSGFTLVELAIAMLLIAILTGAVLKGTEMFRNSQLSATYIQTQTVASALKAFTDKYQALPGDMRDATSRLENCDNTPANSCMNGNGDNQIGDIDNTTDDEYTLFWYHLQAAQLIQEVDLDAPITSPALGVTHPKAQAGGGFAILTLSGEFEDRQNEYLDGVYLYWISQAGGNSLYTSDSLVVSAHDAQFMDTKFDDGRPVGGKIRARGTVDATAGTIGDSPDRCRNILVYTEQTTVGCYMYFKIREARGL